MNNAFHCSIIANEILPRAARLAVNGAKCSLRRCFRAAYMFISESFNINATISEVQTERMSVHLGRRNVKQEKIFSGNFKQR
jgi:hypothetical protein